MDSFIRKHPLAECENCPLYDEGYAEPETASSSAELTLVGIGPGASEARTGKVFVGPSGQLLDTILEDIEITRGLNVHLTNIVLCRPPKDKPTKEAIAACQPRLFDELKEVGAPIVAFGNIPAQALLPEGKKWAGITKERGKQFENPEIGLPINVTYHPAYPLRSPQALNTLHKDLKNFAGKGSIDRRPVRYEAVDGINQILLLINDLHQFPKLVCDLETTGLNVYQGDEILCIAFAWSATDAIIFHGKYLKNQHVKLALKNLFNQPNKTWIGHNFNFDKHFLDKYIGASPQHYDDTQFMHYLTDATKGIHSLKAIAKSDLLGTARFTEQAFTGEVAGSNTIRNGLVGNVYGMEVYVSTNLPTVEDSGGTADNVLGVVFQRDALLLVEQMGVRAQTQYKQEYLADLLTVDMIWGQIRLRNASINNFVVPTT